MHETACRHVDLLSRVRSNQKLAGDKPGGLGSFGLLKNVAVSLVFDDTAAMHQDDVAGEPARLAEVVCRHHHLDAARGDVADQILDRFRRGRIEARGRLVEEQDLRILGERACEREPLLLAAGELSRRPVAEAGEPDQRQQLGRRAACSARGTPAASSA